MNYIKLFFKKYCNKKITMLGLGGIIYTQWT